MGAFMTEDQKQERRGRSTSERLSGVPVPPLVEAPRPGLPGWRAHQGEDSLYYARLPGTQPMVVVNAKTPEKLRDAVRDELRKMDQEE